MSRRLPKPIIYYTYMRNRTQHKLHEHYEDRRPLPFWGQMVLEKGSYVHLGRIDWTKGDWRTKDHRHQMYGHHPLGWRDRSE